MIQAGACYATDRGGVDQIHITMQWPRESERDHQFKQACCEGINFMALWLQFVRVLSSCAPIYLPCAVCVMYVNLAFRVLLPI
ncbi:hypothetical protein CNX70_13395 [Janthinobacterium svalbardensis]|uniref:Uncharacterized protein n=1 Tax=Janthinobacterium svalbardensis TaxID=368607 RepID=A0A290WWR1_9BURK|nr:hypothetical protein CNX70_13395 [Janthinobacterium svalbardensis]